MNHLQKPHHSKSQLPQALKQSLIHGLNQIPSISMRSAASPFVIHIFHRYVARSMFVSPAHVITHLSDNGSLKAFLLYPLRWYTFVLSHSTDLRRIAVHTDYQRRGVAGQLLQWGLGRADLEKLVSYLNGRPQARQLYENSGFRAVNIIPMPVPGLEVADMIAMVRQPQVVKSR
jgi:GNAT superfamily N-acetyltransferase